MSDSMVKAVVCLAIAFGAVSAVAADNAQLKRLFEEDQADRASPPERIDWSRVGARDLERQDAVFALMKAGALSSSNDRWLSAASWDRLMLKKKRPQWYGTQFVKSRRSGRWELYEVDEAAVTDQDRARMGVRSLAEAREPKPSEHRDHGGQKSALSGITGT